jgi:hypothetical protein
VSPASISNLFKSVSVNSATLTVGSTQGGTQYSVAGNVYDIDAGDINYKGSVQVSIPYDPSRLPAGVDESEVRFLHHNGKGWEDATVSVDTAANTVKGKVSSLSPVVPGFIDDGTFSSSYFAKHPLQKMTVSGVSTDVKHTKGSVSQIVLSTTFKNAQRASQTYCVIIQVLDSDGFTEGVRWSSGTIEKGATATVSSSLVMDGTGHKVQVFVWDGIGKSPVPLSATFAQKLLRTLYNI